MKVLVICLCLLIVLVGCFNTTPREQIEDNEDIIEEIVKPVPTPAELAPLTFKPILSSTNASLGDKISLSVEVSNNREPKYTTNTFRNIYFNVIGYSPDLLSSTNPLFKTVHLNNLVSRVQTVPLTEFEVINVPNQVTFSPVIEVFYDYKSTFSGDICYKTDMMKDSDSSICKLNDARPMERLQAGVDSVKVISVQQSTYEEKKLNFRFLIERDETRNNVYRYGEDCVVDSTCDLRTSENFVDVFVNNAAMKGALFCENLMKEDGSLVVAAENYNSLPQIRGYVRLLPGSSVWIECEQELDEEVVFDELRYIGVTTSYKLRDSIKSNQITIS